MVSSSSASPATSQPSLHRLPDELLDDLFVRLGVGGATDLACVCRALNAAYTRFKRHRAERLRRRFHPDAVVALDIDITERNVALPHGQRWAMRDGTLAVVPDRAHANDSLVVVRLWDDCASFTRPLDGEYKLESLAISGGGRLVSLQYGYEVDTGNEQYVEIVSVVFRVDSLGLHLLSKVVNDVSKGTLRSAPRFVGEVLLSLYRDNGPWHSPRLRPHYDIHLCDFAKCTLDHHLTSSCSASHKVARVAHYLRNLDHREELDLMQTTVRAIHTTGGSRRPTNKALAQLFVPHLKSKKQEPSLYSLIVSGSTQSLLLQERRDDAGRELSENGATGIEARELVLTPSGTRLEKAWTSALEPSDIDGAMLLSNESILAAQPVFSYDRARRVTFLRTRDGAILDRYPARNGGLNRENMLPANDSAVVLFSEPTERGQSVLRLYDAYCGEVCGEMGTFEAIPSAVCDDRVVCFMSASRLHVIFL